MHFETLAFYQILGGRINLNRKTKEDLGRRTLGKESVGEETYQVIYVSNRTGGSTQKRESLTGSDNNYSCLRLEQNGSRHFFVFFGTLQGLPALNDKGNGGVADFVHHGEVVVDVEMGGRWIFVTAKEGRPYLCMPDCCGCYPHTRHGKNRNDRNWMGEEQEYSK